MEQTSSSGAQYATARGVPYKAVGIAEDVFVHPSSVVAGGPPPEYVVFSEVVRTTRLWIKGALCVTLVFPGVFVHGSVCV